MTAVPETYQLLLCQVHRGLLPFDLSKHLRIRAEYPTQCNMFSRFLPVALLIVAHLIAVRGQQSPCEAVPEEFWQCTSDCLYKKCGTGDSACLALCDAECSKLIPSCLVAMTLLVLRR